MEYLERRRTLIEGRLEPVLDATEPEAMGDRLAHVALSGGKRVRPIRGCYTTVHIPCIQLC